MVCLFNDLLFYTASAQSTARSTKKKSARKIKKTKKTGKQTKTLEDELTAEDKRLLKEVGKTGTGSPEEIHQLIDEGADPSCVNGDGMPASLILNIVD